MADIKNYTFRTRWSDEDGKWIGQCPAFMHLHFLHDDPVEAVRGIMALVQTEIAKNGLEIQEKSVFQGMDDMLDGAPGPFGRVK